MICLKNENLMAPGSWIMDKTGDMIPYQSPFTIVLSLSLFPLHPLPLSPISIPFFSYIPVFFLFTL